MLQRLWWQSRRMRQPRLTVLLCQRVFALRRQLMRVSRVLLVWRFHYKDGGT